MQFKAFNYKHQVLAKVDDNLVLHDLGNFGIYQMHQRKHSQAFITMFSLLKYVQRSMKVLFLQSIIPLNFCGNFQVKFPMWNRTWTSWELLVGCRFTHQKAWWRKAAIIKNKPVNKIYGTLLVVGSQDLNF